MKGYIATKKLFERSYNWMLIFMDVNSLQSPPQRGRGGRRTAISCERGLRKGFTYYTPHIPLSNYRAEMFAAQHHSHEWDPLEL
jgi:hypothetical protein